MTETERLNELYNQGLSINMMAKKAHRGAIFIKKWLKDNGLTPNYRCTTNSRANKCFNCQHANSRKAEPCYWHKVAYKYKGKISTKMQRFMDENWTDWQQTILKCNEHAVHSFYFKKCKLFKEG